MLTNVLMKTPLEGDIHFTSQDSGDIPVSSQSCFMDQPLTKNLILSLFCHFEEMNEFLKYSVSIPHTVNLLTS